MAKSEDVDKAVENKRDSGVPGGGQGRKDQVGRSGVYPMSGPHPPGPAEIKTEAAWGQGERGAAGYEDHGGSELSYQGGQLLGGLNIGPGGEPLAETEVASEEIPSREWIRFLNNFSREHRGRRASIQVLDSSGQRRTEVEDGVLEGVSSDHLDAEDRVYVETGETPDDHLTHSISQPRRVCFLLARTGEHLGLEIDSQDGTRTFVRFREPKKPEQPIQAA